MSRTAVQDKHQHLQALSRQLALRGFDTDLGATPTGEPLLMVTNPAQPALLSENIACVTVPDGTNRYAWPWGSYLAEVSDMTAAVTDVARVLGGGHG